MKMYALVSYHYDWYEFEETVAVSRSVEKLEEYAVDTSNDLPELFSWEEHEDNDYDDPHCCITVVEYLE